MPKKVEDTGLIAGEYTQSDVLRCKLLHSLVPLCIHLESPGSGLENSRLFRLDTEFSFWRHRLEKQLHQCVRANRI